MHISFRHLLERALRSVKNKLAVMFDPGQSREPGCQEQAGFYDINTSRKDTHWGDSKTDDPEFPKSVELLGNLRATGYSFERDATTKPGFRRIRIVILENSLNVGGAEWASVLLAKHIDPGKFEVLFICYNPEQSPLVNYLASSGIRVYSASDFAGRLPPYQQWISQDMFLFLKEARPDIVMFPSHLLYRSVPSEKVAAFECVVRISNFNTEKIDSCDFSAVRRIVCCSQEQYDRIALTWGEKVALIGTGVDLDQFAPHGEGDKSLLSELSTVPDKVVLFVGRLGDPRKQVGLFMRTVEKLNEIRDDVAILVVGYFNKHQEKIAEEFRQFVSCNPVIWVDDAMPWEMQKYYGVADVLVSTSAIDEGLSNTVLQALASGVIPVTTRSSGMTELIENGRSGFIVDTGNAELLAESLCGALDLTDTQQEKFRIAGLERATSRFNLQDTIGQYQAEFTRIYNDTRGR
jgi:glycosyltransferase involved in cell wall biosynthesis